jgi:hypothetical protein
VLSDRGEVWIPALVITINETLERARMSIPLLSKHEQNNYYFKNRNSSDTSEHNFVVSK